MNVLSSKPLPPDEGADLDEPPRKRSKLRKEEIVQEATRLFAERGYEGASMGDLAERVGLRKASLFHHFASKDALYGAVLGQLLERVRTDIGDALVRDGTFLERMDGLNDRITTILAHEPFTARVLLREMLDYGPVMREHLGEVLDDLLRLARDFIEMGKRDGHVRATVDSTHVVISLATMHLTPFAICAVIESFAGASPFSDAYIEQRKAAIREQSRGLCGVGLR